MVLRRVAGEVVPAAAEDADRAEILACRGWKGIDRDSVSERPWVGARQLRKRRNEL